MIDAWIAEHIVLAAFTGGLLGTLLALSVNAAWKAIGLPRYDITDWLSIPGDTWEDLQEWRKTRKVRSRLVKPEVIGAPSRWAMVGLLARLIGDYANDIAQDPETTEEIAAQVWRVQRCAMVQWLAVEKYNELAKMKGE